MKNIPLLKLLVQSQEWQEYLQIDTVISTYKAQGSQPTLQEFMEAESALKALEERMWTIFVPLLEQQERQKLWDDVKYILHIEG